MSKSISHLLHYPWRRLKIELLRRQAAQIRAAAALQLRQRPLRSSDNVAFTVLLLAGRKSFEDLLFALSSLEHALGGLGPVMVLSDGTLNKNEAAFLSEWHPLTTLAHNIGELADILDYSPAPVLRRFASWYANAPKLLLAAAAQSSRNCLLMDTDVVFFQDPLHSGALESAVSAGRPICLRDEAEYCNAAIIEHMRKKGSHVERVVNSGLVYLPRGCLDATIWEDVIPEDVFSRPYHFGEQSTLAAALTAKGYDFFPPERFVVSSRGAAFTPAGASFKPFTDSVDYGSLVCRHFVTPVRHLMWLTAFPLLAARLGLCQNGS